jgi:hypothetical protein
MGSSSERSTKSPLVQLYIELSRSVTVHHCFFRMQFQPGRLPIEDILAIGWKLLQFSRGGEQRRWRDLTNDKHIEQTVDDPCTWSDLDAAARLAFSELRVANPRRNANSQHLHSYSQDRESPMQSNRL